MNKRFAVVVATALLLGLISIGGTVPTAGASQTCSRVKIAGTHLVFRWHVVKVREHGKIVKRRDHVWRVEHVRVHGKVVQRRVPVKVRVRYFRSVESCTATLTAPVAPVVSAAAATAPAPAAPSATTTTTAVPPVVTLGASLDPSFVQRPTNPLQVTWSYSATATQTSGGTVQTLSSLPSGVLELFSDGSLVSSVNVGGTVDGTQATVTYAAYGTHTVDVVYDAGSASGTTGTESYVIPGPLATTTDLSLIGGSVNTGYQFGASVRDSTGAIVTLPAGAVVFSVITNDRIIVNGMWVEAGWTATTTAPGQSTCTLLGTDAWGSLTFSSPDCTVAPEPGESGSYLATSATTVTVHANYAGAPFDLPSISSEIAYP